MSKCTKKLPANATLLTTVTALVKGEAPSSLKQKTKTPLAPSVSARYVMQGEKKVISANVTVYINASEDIASLDVYLGQTLINGFLPVYIVYDFTPVIPKKLSSYTFSYEILNVTTALKTYAWNEDPETSRGTETTVQPPVMD